MGMEKSAVSVRKKIRWCNFLSYAQGKEIVLSSISFFKRSSNSKNFLSLSITNIFGEIILTFFRFVWKMMKKASNEEKFREAVHCHWFELFPFKFFVFFTFFALFEINLFISEFLLLFSPLFLLLTHSFQDEETEDSEDVGRTFTLFSALFCH